MPEKLLHLTHGRTSFEQMRRKRVPQRMRGHPLAQLRSLRGSPDRGPCALPGQRASPGVQEKRGGSPASCGERRAGAHPICVEGVHCERPDGNDPLFTSLAEQAHDRNVSAQIEVIGTERDGLGDTGPRRVEELEEGGVAQADRRIVSVGRVQQSSHFVDGQGLGEVASLTRGVQLRSSIGADSPLGHRVLVESANSRRRARHRRGSSRSSRDLPRCQPHRVILNVRSADVVDVDLPPHLHVNRVAGDVAVIV